MVELGGLQTAPAKRFDSPTRKPTVSIMPPLGPITFCLD